MMDNHEHPQKLRVGCVLMAAGSAERFGRNKLLEKLEGTALVERVLQQMKELAVRCRVRPEPFPQPELLTVTRWSDIARLSEQAGIPCILYEGGKQSDTIRKALQAAQAETWQGCMFIPGDQPFLAAAGMEKLLEGFACQPDAVHRLGWKERPGSPILFPSAYFGKLKELTGDEGGRVLLRREEIPVVLHQADSEKELADIDTQEDLLRHAASQKG